MSARERITKAIEDMRVNVQKYGWKQSSPEWQRAFGYMSGLSMALELLQDEHPTSRLPSDQL